MVVTKELLDEHFITLLVNEFELWALVDSGATKTLMSQTIAEKLGLKIEPLTTGDLSMLFSADGNALAIIGKARVDFNIAGLKLVHDVNIVRQLSHHLILGCDVLRRTGAILDYGRRKIVFASDSDVFQTDLYTPDRVSRPLYAVAAQTACIGAYCEALVAVTVPRRYNGNTVIMEPIRNTPTPRFATARSLSQCQDGRSYCRIFNFQARDLTLHKGKKLAEIESMASVSSCTPLSDEQLQGGLEKIENMELQPREVLDAFLAEYKFKINENLSVEQKYQLLQTLWENKDIFARNLSELGTYPNFELDIELTSNRKVYRRQFRLSPDDNFEIQRQIEDMEKHNIIEKTDNTDFNSPIFLVNKRQTGQKRCVIDLRLLNSAIRGRTIQLARISDLIDEATLKRANYWTALDLFSGFFCIKIHPSSRDLLSFTSPVTGQRYRYVRTPFGLSTAPMAMSLVINNVFKGQLRKNVYCYLDDILLCERDFQGHINNLINVFRQLRINNLRANPSKCEFAQSKLVFLGFSLSSEGIGIAERQFDIIRKIQPPKSVRAVQRLLGIFNYLKKHIRNYSQNTYHMRQLLQKNTPFYWSEDCQRELIYLQSAILSRPTLQPLDPTKDIVIQTDGSSMGLGWIILQRDDKNRLHVVCYGGQALTAAQSHYHSAELELFALTRALNSIEWVARHRKVTVFTDSSRVLHLNSWTAVNNRQRRILLYLMQFHLDLRYLSGARNLPADALSRIYEDMTQEQRQELIPVADTNDDFIVTLSEDNTMCPEKSPECSEVTTVDENVLRGGTEQLIQQQQQQRDGELNVWTRSKTAQQQASELRPTAAEFIPRKNQQGLDSECCMENMQQLDSSADVESGAAEIINKPSDGESSLQQQPESGAEGGVEQFAAQDLIDDVQTSAADVKAEMLHGSAENKITANDYYADSEFRPIYQYLADGILTGNQTTDKKTVLLADQFFIRNELLYRISLPRRKRGATEVIEERLCIPRLYRLQVLHVYHDEIGGHFGVRRVYAVLYARFYWQTMYADIQRYVQTCDLCQRSKRNFAFRTAPLNPVAVPETVLIKWSVDLKNLPRKTPDGHVAILVCVECLSGYVKLCLVKDEKTETICKAFVQTVVCTFGAPLELLSDRGANLTSKIFQYMMEFMGIKHRISASRAPRTNGIAEAQVKRVNELIRRLCTCDSQIQEIIPLIEFILNSTNQAKMQYSPFEILFGLKPRLCQLEEIKPPVSFSGNFEQYLNILRTEMNRIRQEVYNDKVEMKEQERVAYDKQHRVKVPTWSVGQKVLLLDNKPRANSDVILSHKMFIGPFFISECVKGDPTIGMSYRLISVETGRTYPFLITGDRLKAYDDRRMNLEARMNRPVLGVESEPKTEQLSVGEDEKKLTQGVLEPAIRVIKERRNAGKREFLVLFPDNHVYWCDKITNLLLKDWRLRSKSRSRRRKR